jgi:16S rRNA (adenine1518-N6/adenine1519-N6)-dimethyltransferase
VPDVISAVVHFDFGIPFTSQATDDAMFRTTVRGTFGKRRKTLRNSLKSIGVTADILDAVSIPLDQRPEELGVSDFVILANELSANHAVISLSHSSQE